jgi:hypothetical protein
MTMLAFIGLLIVLLPAFVLIYWFRAYDPEGVDGAFGWRAQKEEYWKEAEAIEARREKMLRERRNKTQPE